MAPMLRGMPPATFSRRLPRLGIAIGVLWISFAVFFDAWGQTAHRVISRAAVALPSEVPAFVGQQIDWIGVRSITPDSWRNASEPFAFKTTIPRSRYELVLALYDEYNVCNPSILSAPG